MASTATAAPKRRPFYTDLFFQVVVATIIGILLGIYAPKFAVDLKPFGDGFIRLIKMVFAPVISLTVILGVARMESMKELGKVGVISLIYFEVVSTFALILGLISVHLLQPGVGMNVDPHTLDTAAIASYTAAKTMSWTDFLLNIIPNSIFEAFVKNDVLQIIFFSIMLGTALSVLGKRVKPLVDALENLMDSVFYVVRIIMRVAPIGTLGAIAFTVGKYGTGSILSLAKVLGDMYLTAGLFIAIVLNIIARLSGFSLWKFMGYLKDEMVTVFATGSSESVLPQVMEKLSKLGISKTVVGIVVPSGLTFNPDGQCIYYTLAAIFVAQATNTPLTFMDQLIVLGVLMIASKGSAGVTGSGFITLAAVLASLGKIPVAGMVLLLGVDPFMSRARGFTNTLGTAVSAVAIARFVGAVDDKTLRSELSGSPALQQASAGPTSEAAARE